MYLKVKRVSKKNNQSPAAAGMMAKLTNISLFTFQSFLVFLNKNVCVPTLKYFFFTQQKLHFFYLFSQSPIVYRSFYYLWHNFLSKSTFSNIKFKPCLFFYIYIKMISSLKNLLPLFTHIIMIVIQELWNLYPCLSCTFTHWK